MSNFLFLSHFRVEGHHETAESEVFNFDIASTNDHAQDESVEATESSELHANEIEEEKCIVSVNKIIELLKGAYGLTCQRCDNLYSYHVNPIGTALIVRWSCKKGHQGGTWHSQARYSDMFSGNIQFPSAVSLSGNNFSKIALFFKVCKIYFVSDSTFFRLQKLYIAPAVKEYWQNAQSELFQSLKQTQVSIAGDGRTDSLGHCAQYCTYTFMDTSTSKVLHVDISDVREAGGKSTNLERLSFERGFDYLLKHVNVKSIVTDAHVQILALIKNCEKYDEITHDIDIWHGAKNFMKKVISIAQIKGNEDLKLWLPAIRNHFWHCARECEGDELKFKALWWSLLHHIVDEHEWTISIDGSIGACNHWEVDSTERNKPWLKKDSPAHAALRKVMTDKRFISKFRYYKNFKHTGQLESFNNHVLMYASKRCSYRFEGYAHRMLLAAIDHNYHVAREYAKNSKGEQIYRAKFSKRTKQWAPQKVKVGKDYGYIPHLMGGIFEMRGKTEGHLSQHVSLASNDPCNLQPNIASVPKPDMKTLLNDNKSRFVEG